MAEIVKNYNNGSAIKVVYSYTQNIAKNQSTLTMTLYVHRDSYGPSWNTHCNAYIQVNGSSAMTYDGSFNIGTSWVKIGSTVSKVITHDADGTKTVTLKGFFDSEGLTSKLANLTVSGTYDPENHSPGQQLFTFCQHSNSRQYKFEGRYYPGFVRFYPHGQMGVWQPQQEHYRRGDIGLLHHPGKLAGCHPKQHKRHRNCDGYHLQWRHQNRQRQQELYSEGCIGYRSQLYRYYLYPY